MFSLVYRDFTVIIFRVKKNKYTFSTVLDDLRFITNLSSFYLNAISDFCVHLSMNVFYYLFESTLVFNF